jgi:DNA-binding CsgD family transcriptional regulator
MRRGLSTAAIADELRISSVTVRRHLSGVYAKLGAGSRREALEVLADVDHAPSR